MFKTKKTKIRETEYLKNNGYPRDYDVTKEYKVLFGESITKLYKYYDYVEFDTEYNEYKYFDKLGEYWYNQKLLDPKLFDRLRVFYIYVTTNMYYKDTTFASVSTSIKIKFLPYLSDEYNLMDHKGFYKPFIKYIHDCHSFDAYRYLTKLPVDNNYHYFELLMNPDHPTYRYHTSSTYRILMKLFIKGTTNPKKYMHRVLSEFGCDVVNAYSAELFTLFDKYGESEFISLMTDRDPTYSEIFREYMDQCESVRKQRITDKAATLLSKITSDILPQSYINLMYNCAFTSERLQEFITKFKIVHSEAEYLNFSAISIDGAHKCIECLCNNSKEYYTNKLIK